MTTVRQLLQDKGSDVASIAPDDSVYDAMQIMATREIGALLVLEPDKLIGIYTERDYSRKMHMLDKPVRDTLVKELMTSKVVHVNPNDTIETCMELITKMRVRHLPVLENNQVIGIISISDLIKDIISGQEIHIKHLEQYIYFVD